MTIASNFKKLGLKLMKKNGQEAVFTRTVNGGYIPSALGRSEGTPITYTVAVFPIDFNLNPLRNGQNDAGVTVLEGSKKLYVSRIDTSGNEITPQVGDSVSLNSIDYRVLEVLTYEAQGTDCAYLLKIGV